MKILSLSTALALTLTLSACGGATTPTPTPAEPTLTPEESEALTKTFTATGPVLRYTPTADIALTAVIDETRLPIGTLKADGTLDIQITAAQARSLYAYSFKEMIDERKDDQCDMSGLTVQNTAYFTLSQIAFTAADGVSYILRDQTFDTDASGTTTQAISSITFSLGNGSMKGKMVCGESTVNYDVTLKPGWNITKSIFVLDAKRKLLSNSRSGDLHTATYSAGNWNAFKAQP